MKEEEHDQRLEELLRNPRLIGLENVKFSAKESSIYGDDGNLICKPDLLFMVGYAPREIYVVEYKNGGSGTRMRAQLASARTFFESRGLTVHTLGVYNNGKGQYGICIET